MKASKTGKRKMQEYNKKYFHAFYNPGCFLTVSKSKLLSFLVHFMNSILRLSSEIKFNGK